MYADLLIALGAPTEAASSNLFDTWSQSHFGFLL